MSNKRIFDHSIAYFYQSLSESIAERMEKLDLRPAQVTRDDPKRAKAVINNQRSDRYRTLIGKSEYIHFLKLFRFETTYDFKTCILEEQDFTIKEQDNLLWGHIDWNQMYQLMMKDFLSIPIKKNSQLLNLYEHSLLNYVPFAIQKAHVEKSNNPFSDYFAFKMPSKLSVGGEVLECFDFELDHYDAYEELMIVRQDATNWVYFKDIEQTVEMLKTDFTSSNKLAVGEFVEDFLTLTQRSKQEFTVDFGGKTLRKFDDKFEKFAFSWIEKLIKQNQPQNRSFGLKAYIHANELLETMEFDELASPRDKENSGLFYFEPSLIWDEAIGEFISSSEELVDVASDYLKFEKDYLKGLESFQKKFDQ